MASDWWQKMLKENREHALTLPASVIISKLLSLYGYDFNKDVAEKAQGAERQKLKELEAEYPVDIVQPRIKAKLQAFLKEE